MIFLQQEELSNQLSVGRSLFVVSAIFCLLPRRLSDLSHPSQSAVHYFPGSRWGGLRRVLILRFSVLRLRILGPWETDWE